MGGLLIVVAVIIATLLWAELSNPFVWVEVMATLGFALVGFVDDRSKVLKKHNLGLTARGKILWLVGVSLAVAVSMYLLAERGYFITELYFPFFSKTSTPI